MDAGIYRYYKSPASAEEVKSFFLDELPRVGWIQMSDPDFLGFRKDQFEIVVDHSQGVSDWNYAISFVWRAEQ